MPLEQRELLGFRATTPACVRRRPPLWGEGWRVAPVSGILGLAEIEHEYRQERQAAGIAVAKRKGRYHGRAKGTTKAQPARARLLYDRGLTVGEIQQALQISRRTVYRYLATEGKA